MQLVQVMPQQMHVADMALMQAAVDQNGAPIESFPPGVTPMSHPGGTWALVPTNDAARELTARTNGDESPPPPPPPGQQPPPQHPVQRRSLLHGYPSPAAIDQQKG